MGKGFGMKRESYIVWEKPMKAAESLQGGEKGESELESQGNGSRGCIDLGPPTKKLGVIFGKGKGINYPRSLQKEHGPF